MVNFASYVHITRFQMQLLKTDDRTVSDTTILLRSMAGDAAQNAATRVNPSEDRLAQIDHPAEDNIWHDVPNLTSANLKGQARDAYNKNKPFNKGDMKNAANDAAQSANNTGTSDPAEAADVMRQQQQSGMDTQLDANAGVNTLQNHARDNIPQETQDRVGNVANSAKDRTRAYLTNKLPPERRDQTIYRLKKMVVEIQGHRDCMYFIPSIRNVFLTMYRRASY